MINFEALFKVSYGLYLVCSGDKTYGNGLISNTVFQVTAEPAKFATCVNKNNHSCDIISKSSAFSVSILSQSTDYELISLFGYKSGKDINKLNGLNIKYSETGVPIVLDGAIAWLEFKVVDQVDLGTHIMFIGELINSELIDESLEPLTYSYYRKVMKGLAPKNAPTYIDKSKLPAKEEKPTKQTYKCTVCGYEYDDDTDFDSLPDDWKCPVCGAEKEDFILSD